MYHLCRTTPAQNDLQNVVLFSSYLFQLRDIFCCCCCVQPWPGCIMLVPGCCQPRGVCRKSHSGILLSDEFKFGFEFVHAVDSIGNRRCLALYYLMGGLLHHCFVPVQISASSNLFYQRYYLQSFLGEPPSMQYGVMCCLDLCVILYHICWLLLCQISTCILPQLTCWFSWSVFDAGHNVDVISRILHVER